LKKRGKEAKKASTSEDFWITSTHDMDNSAVHSQGSISSASITNPPADSHGSSCNPTEFVNHGTLCCFLFFFLLIFHCITYEKLKGKLDYMALHNEI